MGIGNIEELVQYVGRAAHHHVSIGLLNVFLAVHTCKCKTTNSMGGVSYAWDVPGNNILIQACDAHESRCNVLILPCHNAAGSRIMAGYSGNYASSLFGVLTSLSVYFEQLLSEQPFCYVIDFNDAIKLIMT